MRVPAVCAALLALSACAAAEPVSLAGGHCFRTDDVTGFRAVDGIDDQALVVVGARSFRATVEAACPDVDFTNRGLRLDPRGGRTICRAEDADLLVPGPSGGVRRCQVTALTPVG